MAARMVRTSSSTAGLDQSELNADSSCSFSSLKSPEGENGEPMESSDKLRSSASDLSQDARPVQVAASVDDGKQQIDSDTAACCLFEIDLSSPVRSERASEMLNDYRQPSGQLECLAIAGCDTHVQQKRQDQHQATQFLHAQMGFKQEEAKLAVTSRRVKQYFESLRSRKASNGNMYQFFKSARSELAACLLFCLISSQALIVSRQFFSTASSAGEALSAPSSLAPQTIAPPSSIDSKTPLAFRSVVRLVGGLADAFTVASLTQVFGHISGCHLVPSVSLALYFKGHISRARLLAYLGAQSLGALLGVGLLGLLTSSQVTGSSQVTHLVNSTHEPGAHNVARSWPTNAPRRRREVGNQDEPSADFNLNDIQGSETILLSIMEQAERKTISRPANVSDQPTTAPNDQSHAHLNLVTRNKTEDAAYEPATSLADRPVIRLRRRKRQRVAAARSPEAPNQIDAEEEGFVNQLHMALPDVIMVAGSMGECEQEISGGYEIRRPSARLLCQSSSNPSQMFIFQLLANLLVVLTYLANVDPRRLDLGFKSLSIGLSYALAALLTVQSGGFIGNPMHLIALVCFSSGKWRTEWLVYLICPLVGGLFGALSHEYVDFSSLKRRNKALQLRRSFYSLDALCSSVEAGAKPPGDPGQVERPRELPSLSGALSAAGKRSSVSEGAASGWPTNSPDSNVDASSSVLTLADDSSDRKSSVSYSRQVRAEQLRLARRLRAERTRLGRRASAGAPSPLNFDANFLVGSPAAGCCR